MQPDTKKVIPFVISQKRIEKYLNCLIAIQTHLLANNGKLQNDELKQMTKFYGVTSGIMSHACNVKICEKVSKAVYRFKIKIIEPIHARQVCEDASLCSMISNEKTSQDGHRAKYIKKGNKTSVANDESVNEVIGKNTKIQSRPVAMEILTGLRVSDKVFIKKNECEVIIRALDSENQLATVSYKQSPKLNWKVPYFDILNHNRPVAHKNYVISDEKKRNLKQISILWGLIRYSW